MHVAWQREKALVPNSWLLQGERAEALLERLDESLELVKGLRNAGRPQAAMQVAGRDASQAIARLRQLAWSMAHLEVLRKVSALVLEEVKAGLDFLPRKLVRIGGLNPQLGLLKGAGELCDDTQTRFVSALALEGATYVSGDVATSFRQTRDLLDRSERIPEPWVPEVLRAAAINAGKSKKVEALVDVQARIDELISRKLGELPTGELEYLLEGLARAWSGFDQGRASELANAAWTASAFDLGGPPSSALRYVQLSRTQAEIALARNVNERDSRVRDRVETALSISRRENYDRYTDQLEALRRRLG